MGVLPFVFQPRVGYRGGNHPQRTAVLWKDLLPHSAPSQTKKPRETEGLPRRQKEICRAGFHTATRQKVSRDFCMETHAKKAGAAQQEFIPLVFIREVPRRRRPSAASQGCRLSGLGRSFRPFSKALARVMVRKNAGCCPCLSLTMPGPVPG